MNRYYKAARPDGFDFYTGKTINYRENIGKIVRCPNRSTTARLCSSSVIHASENPFGVFLGTEIPCSLFVVKGIPVCGDDKKSGFKEFEILYEIPQNDLNEIFEFNYLESCNPINPFEIEPPEISNVHLELLQDWKSILASLEEPIMKSVRDTVEKSDRALTWSVVNCVVWNLTRRIDLISSGDSIDVPVWSLLWEPVWAYAGTLFPKIKQWEYCENIKTEGYPFQPAVELWKMGIVPIHFDNNWKLHTKYGIAWEE